eukprot:COSAG01_NODE_13808_length_1532_cov_1.771110_2_plen_198_part_00
MSLDEPTLAELRALKPRQLRERATALGATVQQVEAAQDEEDAKSALLRLNLVFTSTLDLEELRATKVPALRERVLAGGVDGAAVEAARDADNQKGELIGLLLEHQAEVDERAAAQAAQRAVEAAQRAAAEAAARAAAEEREAKLKAELELAKKTAAQRTDSSDKFTLGPPLDGKVHEATNETTHEKVAAKQHTDLAM